MDSAGRTESEGYRRILLAVAAGGLVFPCWLALPFGGGFFGYAGSDLVELLPSAHPTTLEFMRWAGAGIMAGLVSACVAPRRRWIIVPPLLVLLEVGWAILIFLGVGAGDIPVPPGTPQGICVGLVVGVLAVVLCRPGMRPAKRLATVVLTAIVLLAVPAISAWRGRGELAAVREHVLPAVERLLGSDVLVDTTPVQWIAVRRRLSDVETEVTAGPEDGSFAALEKLVERVLVGIDVVHDGALYWHAYGEMRNPRAQIALDWHDNPCRWAVGAQGLDGFRVEEMEVNLAAPQPFALDEFLRRRDTKAIGRVLESMGVQPELTASIELPKASDNASCDAVAVYHGIKYCFDSHYFPFYEFERMSFTPDSILITCSGTYSASTP